MLHRYHCGHHLGERKHISNWICVTTIFSINQCMKHITIPFQPFILPMNWAWQHKAGRGNRNMQCVPMSPSGLLCQTHTGLNSHMQKGGLSQHHASNNMNRGLQITILLFPEQVLHWVSLFPAVISPFLPTFSWLAILFICICYPTLSHSLAASGRLT